MPRVGFLEKDHISGIKKILLLNGLTVFLEELPEYKKVDFFGRSRCSASGTKRKK